MGRNFVIKEDAKAAHPLAFHHLAVHRHTRSKAK